jgi:para-nitrobenzyl esterase
MLRTSLSLLALRSVAAVSVAALPFAGAAQEAPTPQEAPVPARYSVTETQVGTLLDDPAAAAILRELIPTVFANEMFQTMGRSQTLAAIQQYEPAELTDEKLAQIQAEFDKLAAPQ